MAKINCVEGQEALQRLLNLTRQLLSVPKSEIDEMEWKWNGIGREGPVITLPFA
jgi:hypothetical protein